MCRYKITHSYAWSCVVSCFILLTVCTVKGLTTDTIHEAHALPLFLVSYIANLWCSAFPDVISKAFVSSVCATLIDFSFLFAWLSLVAIIILDYFQNPVFFTKLLGELKKHKNKPQNPKHQNQPNKTLFPKLLFIFKASQNKNVFFFFYSFGFCCVKNYQKRKRRIILST